MNEVKRISTIDYIYEKLIKDIIEMTFKPNEHLVEANLAKRLEVSRTPLRQALYRLELEGLVTKNPNGRITVSPVSIQEAEEIFLVREIIEGLIVREATTKIFQSSECESIINSLEDITHLMRKSAESNRYKSVVSYGSEFHGLLAKHSENTTAVNILEQLNNRISRYRRLGAYIDPDYPSIIPVNEHENILKHIIKQDAVAAENAMRDHIRRSLKNTISAISYI